jgi:uncharacterized protein
MGVTTDELSAPLGLERKQKAPFRISVYQAVLAASALFALVFITSALVARNHSGDNATGASGAPSPVAASGSPVIMSKQTERSDGEAAAPETAEEARNARAPAALPSAPQTRTITIIDGTSGKQQEVVIPAWPSADSADAQPVDAPRRNAGVKAPGRGAGKSAASSSDPGALSPPAEEGARLRGARAGERR